MREEDSNWFSKWEEQLPSPDELMPLSQSLITPDLASAFDIPIPGSGGVGVGGGGTAPVSLFHHQYQQSSSSPRLGSHIDNYGVQSSSTQTQQHNSSEFDSSSAELCCGVGGDQEPARTLKRPRLVWTPQLHKRFVDAVAHLGIKNAVPKTIMQLMSVDGLTRENVASHLQKYRLYLKRMQGANNGVGNGPAGLVDSASDQLFASSPVPAHFLHQVAGVPSPGPGPGPSPGVGVRSNSDHFISYVPVTALQHQQMVHALTQAQAQTQTPYSQNHHTLTGQFGSIQGNGQLDHPFLSRQAQLGQNRNGILLQDLESGGAGNNNNNSRKVLTLFPNDDD